MLSYAMMRVIRRRGYPFLTSKEFACRRLGLSLTRVGGNNFYNASPFIRHLDYNILIGPVRFPDGSGC